MKKNIIISCIVSLFIFSCKHASPSFREINDKDFTMQVIELPNVTDEMSSLSYKIRITPAKQLLQQKNREEKNALMYKMDSCFYLQGGINKTYAALTQPIANGINGSYEYLIQFEIAKQIDRAHLVLTYQDKYINRKTYTIQFNQQ